MSGLNQLPSWKDNKPVRDCVICENNHDPFVKNLRTLVTEKYKMTVCFGCDFGELYDLSNNPLEIDNLWEDENYKDIKIALYHKFLNEIISMEIFPMPRIAGA